MIFFFMRHYWQGFLGSFLMKIGPKTTQNVFCKHFFGTSPKIWFIPQSKCPTFSKSLENYGRSEFFQCLSVNLSMRVDPGLIEILTDHGWSNFDLSKLRLTSKIPPKKSCHPGRRYWEEEKFPSIHLPPSIRIFQAIWVSVLIDFH